MAYLLLCSLGSRHDGGRLGHFDSIYILFILLCMLCVLSHVSMVSVEYLYLFMARSH